MREKLLAIYGVVAVTFQAILYTIRQYYLRWQYERAIGKIMRAYDRRQRTIGKAILPAVRRLIDKIEKGA